MIKPELDVKVFRTEISHSSKSVLINSSTSRSREDKSEKNNPIKGSGGLSKNVQKRVQNVHNWIISIRSRFILF